MPTWNPSWKKSDSDGSGKGTFIIATVKGDVHDIGKNLVDIILSNNGYKVVNLGIKQPVENIIQAYREHNADCIAMSGLLVKSTAFMKDNLETFNEEGITVPVILGGAALTPKFVHQDCQNTYNGKVVYGKDAFADLHFMDKLMPAKEAGNWDDLKGFLDEESEGAREQESEKVENQQSAEAASEATTLHPSPLTLDSIDTPPLRRRRSHHSPPHSPLLGHPRAQSGRYSPWRRCSGIWICRRCSWVSGSFRKPKDQSREEYDAFLKETVHPILDNWKARIKAENLLYPQIVYGYFPCLAEGNSLHIYDPAVVGESSEEIQNSKLKIQNLEPIATFTFPRQKSLRRLCIADFFLPKEQAQPGQFDVFPMQAVTVGEVATEFAQKLFKADQYTDYLYYYGLSVQTAEAMAEWCHARIRKELGYGDFGA